MKKIRITIVRLGILLITLAMITGSVNSGYIVTSDADYGYEDTVVESCIFGKDSTDISRDTLGKGTGSVTLNDRPFFRLLDLISKIMNPSEKQNTNPLPDPKWHVYPGDLIQDAVDNAVAGDTIYVHDDNGNPYTYVENVDVDKQLHLIGNDMDMVTVKAEDAGDHTFHLTADGITMSGFTVTNSYLCGYGGIGIEGADNCEIHDNKCTSNLCAGIFLKYSNNCEIKNNIVSNNNCGGIKLAENSNYNTVTGNTVENNKNWGMNVYGESNNNLIYNNYFAGDAAVNLVEDHNTNTWNIEKTPGENIVGGPYLGGNYYDIYESSDNDGDGIGDTPYQIPGGSSVDHLPLVEWTPQPELSYSPHSHNFGDMDEGQTDSTTFEIWNSGTETLTYSLSESCSWIDVHPTNGDSTGEHDTITVNIDTTGLSVGSHSCDISITSNGGNSIFPVTVNIVEEPVLAYNPTSHDFGNMRKGQTDITTFEIWNSGTETITYTLSETCGWVDVSPTSGTSTGEHDTITVDIDTTALSSGDHTCNINIGSNDGSGTFTVAVTIVGESEEPVLSYNPHSHDFGNKQEGWEGSTTFEVWNSGTGTLTYILSESCGWVDVGPTSGNSTGERDTVTVYVDATGLDGGLYTCNISIFSSEGNGTFTMILDIPSSKLDGILSVSDETPGFQAVIVIAGLLLVTTIIFLRKKRGVK